MLVMFILKFYFRLKPIIMGFALDIYCEFFLVVIIKLILRVVVYMNIYVDKR
jgi:tellurite resistance protein TehA-like permease